MYCKKTLKKKMILRVVGIGAFHSILYLWIVPFVLLPIFGENGFYFAVVVAVLISITVLIPILVKTIRKLPTEDRCSNKGSYRK